MSESGRGTEMLRTEAEDRDVAHWICSQAMGARALYAGTVTSGIPQMLAQEGYEVEAFDPDVDAVAAAALAAEPTPLRLRYTADAFMRQELPSGAFDSVVLYDLLPGLSNPARGVERAAGCLKEGAHLVVAVPMGANGGETQRNGLWLSDLYTAVSSSCLVLAVAFPGEWIGIAGVRKGRRAAPSLPNAEDFIRQEAAFGVLLERMRAQTAQLQTQVAQAQAKLTEHEALVADYDAAMRSAAEKSELIARLRGKLLQKEEVIEDRDKTIKRWTDSTFGKAAKRYWRLRDKLRGR